MSEQSFEKIITSTPEVKKTNERQERKEQIENKSEEIKVEKEKIKTNIQSASTPSVPVQGNTYMKERAKIIDSILSEGLDDVFLKLDVQHQKEFKKKGEETVNKINKLLTHTKIKVKKIISLIKEWLKIIPGVNKFFLEQESKIKADKIIEMKNKF